MNNRAQGGAKTFVREVKTGLTVLALLGVVLVYVAYRSYTRTSEIPSAVINSSNNANKQGNRNPQRTGRPATILRAEPSDGSVQSPSQLNFQPAEIRKSLPSVDIRSLSPPAPFLPIPDHGGSEIGTSFDGLPRPWAQDNPREATGSEAHRPANPTFDGGLDPPAQLLAPGSSSSGDFRPIEDSFGSGPFRIEDRTNHGIVGREKARTNAPSPEIDRQKQPALPRTMQVQPNDSFWLISERAYGTGVYFQALYEHNRPRFPEPDRLPPGAAVAIPTLTELRNKYGKFCPESRSE